MPKHSTATSCCSNTVPVGPAASIHSEHSQVGLKSISFTRVYQFVDQFVFGFSCISTELTLSVRLNLASYNLIHSEVSLLGFFY